MLVLNLSFCCTGGLGGEAGLKTMTGGIALARARHETTVVLLPCFHPKTRANQDVLFHSEELIGYIQLRLFLSLRGSMFLSHPLPGGTQPAPLEQPTCARCTLPANAPKTDSDGFAGSSRQGERGLAVADRPQTHAQAVRRCTILLTCLVSLSSPARRLAPLFLCQGTRREVAVVTQQTAAAAIGMTIHTPLVT